MKIEFWSDIVCPYCGLMDHRLRVALGRFNADDVQVVHRSFQTHPDLPREGITQRELLRRAGLPGETGERILTCIEATAHAEGLQSYHALERNLGPTDLAHELLAYAAESGRGQEIWTAMFRAHFGQARNLWTLQEVLDFANDVGLDRDAASEALRDRRYRAQVEADQREALRLGAQGAPFLVIDRSFAAHGAVSVDDLLTTLNRARQTRSVQIFGDTGESCSPVGCVVPPPPTV
ncbi:DsbA family protein [Streptomyces sp. CNZ748]|uniref:DsbA family oxidoreductase n=1 Tax=Streptomyces sp. CNZ748 TaxID=2885160 RepID=UPI001E5D1ED5|nr:DsbA family protein [Streptomyces sp. CNZ748]